MGKKFENDRAAALNKISKKLRSGEQILHTAVGTTSGRGGIYNFGSGPTAILAVTERHLLDATVGDKMGAMSTRWFDIRDLKVRKGWFLCTLQYAIVFEYPHGRGEARTQHAYTLGRQEGRPFVDAVQRLWLARQSQK